MDSFFGGALFVLIILVALWALYGLLLLLFVAGGRGDPDEQDENDRWLAALAEDLREEYDTEEDLSQQNLG